MVSAARAPNLSSCRPVTVSEAVLRVVAPSGPVAREDRLRERADESCERERPRSQSQVRPIARDYVQELELERARHLEGAGGVHAEREYRAPVQRIISERKPRVGVPSHEQHNEHGDPPRAGR